MSREEDAYVIERMGKLLAEIAIVVNGPEPPLTRWSYHDLPEKVRALKEAQQPAAAVPEGGLRDSVLHSARFRAACYALVGIVEGIEGRGRCWAANGERLKDTQEWVAFYNCAAAMRNGTFDQASAEQSQQPAALAVPAEPVAWQYRFATPDGLTWSDWQQISSEAMAREMVEAFGKAGTRAEWRSLKVFDWGGYAGECTDADFADERAQQPAAAVPDVDWRELYRIQTAMRYMDNNPGLTRDHAFSWADQEVADAERAMLAAAERKGE